MSDFDPTAKALEQLLSGDLANRDAEEARVVTERKYRERLTVISGNVLHLVNKLYKPKRVLGIDLGATRRAGDDKLPKSFRLTTGNYRTEKRHIDDQNSVDVGYRFDLTRRVLGIAKVDWIIETTEKGTVDPDARYVSETTLASLQTHKRENLEDDIEMYVMGDQSLELLTDPDSQWWEIMGDNLSLAVQSAPSHDKYKSTTSSLGPSDSYKTSIELGIGLIPGTLFPKK